jgi:hypothetical protein
MPIRATLERILATTRRMGMGDLRIYRVQVRQNVPSGAEKRFRTISPTHLEVNNLRIV